MSRAEERRKTKQRQKAIHKLQVELAKEIAQAMRAHGAPMEMAEIVANYPPSERSLKSDAKTLKQYVMMGLGYMIQEKMVRQLPVDEQGRYLLELIG